MKSVQNENLDQENETKLIDGNNYWYLYITLIIIKV